MLGKFKLEEATNPQPNSSDAPNATTHSENTARLYDFHSVKAKILNTILDLRRRGYSEYTLRNYIMRAQRLLNCDYAYRPYIHEVYSVVEEKDLSK
jgi:hypothetical protein